jgi:hypothetical protein
MNDKIKEYPKKSERKDIGDLLLTKLIDEPLQRSINNSEFVAKLIEDPVSNWKK